MTESAMHSSTLTGMYTNAYRQIHLTEALHKRMSQLQRHVANFTGMLFSVPNWHAAGHLQVHIKPNGAFKFCMRVRNKMVPSMNRLLSPLYRRRNRMWSDQRVRVIDLKNRQLPEEMMT